MDGSSVYGDLLRVLAALAVVVPAAYLSTRFLSGRVWTRRTRYMTLLESLPLGSQRGLHLVRVGERLWLVGGSEKGVNLLAEVGPASELRPVGDAGEGGGRAPAGAGFLRGLGWGWGVLGGGTRAQGVERREP